MEQPDSDTAWMDAGNCRSVSPSVFFPSDGVGVEVARQICRDCPVKHPCLEYALTNHIDHGVWGGTSERENLILDWDLGIPEEEELEAGS